MTKNVHDFLPGHILFAEIVMLCALNHWLQRQQLQRQKMAVFSGYLFDVL